VISGSGEPLHWMNKGKTCHAKLLFLFLDIDRSFERIWWDGWKCRIRIL